MSKRTKLIKSQFPWVPFSSLEYFYLQTKPALGPKLKTKLQNVFDHIRTLIGPNLFGIFCLMRHRKVRSLLILYFSSFFSNFYFCQDFHHWWRTNMRTHILYVPLICITFTNWSEALNFYTGTVTTNTSNVIFDTLLSGNDLFENLYGTFNNTGLLLFGGALLLGSGKLETEWEWFHFSWQY